jgi:hypothetical protein
MEQVIRDNNTRPEPMANVDQLVSNDLLRVIDARWATRFVTVAKRRSRPSFESIGSTSLVATRRSPTYSFSFFANSIPPEQTHLLKTHPEVRYFFLEARDFYKIKLARWNNLPHWKKLLTRRPTIHEIDVNTELKALEQGETRTSGARARSPYSLP